MAEEHCVYTVKILPHRSPSRREASNWQAWSWVFLALFCIVRVCVEPSSFDAMLFLVAKHGDHTRAKPIHRPLFPRVGWGWRLITSTREWPGKNFSRFWDFFLSHGKNRSHLSKTSPTTDRLSLFSTLHRSSWMHNKIQIQSKMNFFSFLTIIDLGTALRGACLSLIGQ